MIRSLILIGFTYLIFQLHLSGDISKYINMKYSYLSAIAGYALLVLTIVQILMLNKDHSRETGCEHDHGGHNHSKEDKWYKKLLIYPIFAFPIISGLFFPIATLDSNIVKAKGFHFPIYDEGKGDPFMQQQFLRPDTSVYYAKDEYDSRMKNEKKKYVNQKTIALNDKNYLNGMETIYNFPGDFLDKEIEFKGFVFNDAETIDKNQIFVFRFGIIHCIADSGVFGMLVDMPAGTKLGNDEWITVKGKISTLYYQPFKTNIPILNVEKWTKTSAPKDQYVYKGN
ncbi:TIGR03943 family putative permease subunit [Neobacillus soli]|uniref:TIGR03943 family putative permease subunit n=1 Tax=Neobacillus soli TaxID=220688 RepID=UPI000825AA05|nr:TIGR03943 family protein [Neobacillus soli]